MNIKNRILKLGLERKMVYGILIISLIVIVFYVVNNLDYGNFDTSFYTKSSSEISNSMRVVMIADLHMRQFGKGNEKLIQRVKALSPDLIAIPGDMTTSWRRDHDVAMSTVKQLTEIAPVYYSYGNHEYKEILFKEGSTLLSDMKQTGAHILNNTYETVEINGNTMQIGGFCVNVKGFENKKVTEFLNKYQQVDGFKLLLCHHPEVFSKKMEGYPVDLALSGHAHGGQVRLPIIGGLFSPDQGLFPKYTEGMHHLSGSDVIITRGLGNSHLIPRFNNNAEIVVLDLRGY